MRLIVRRSWTARAALSGLALALMGSSAAAQTKAADKPAAPAAAPQPVKKPAKPKTEKEKKEGAKKAFEGANAKYAAGDFAAAAGLYQEADALIPGAVPKYKAAEALDKAGDVEGAITAYELLINSKPEAKHQDKVDEAKKRVEELKVAPADVKVVITPPEATGVVISVDGKAQPGNPVQMPAGKHTLSAVAEGFEAASVEVEVKRGEKKEVPLTLTAKATQAAVVVPPAGTVEAPKEPPTTEQSGGGSTLIPAIVTLSLAGAGAVVGGVFGGLALASKSDFEATPTQELFDETERNALIADMSFGVALTFGVTGIVLLLTDSGDEPAADAEKTAGFTFAPYAGPSGAGAVGSFTF